MTLCALAAAALFAACGEGDNDNGDENACQSGAPAPMGTYSAPPPMTIDRNKQYFATIKMDIGDIKLELYPKEAPCHVNSFVFLAREKFYDGVTFHRVLPGFVAQGGDPTGTGSGGPGYTVPLEVSETRKHVDGALAMARTSNPDSAGSQFFINYGPQPALEPGGSDAYGYTVFGGIVEGRDVLDKITPRDPARPGADGIEATKINTIVIEEQ
jgi:cyclophilin family peptidyl-prolyl cis-trans isomerase